VNPSYGILIEPEAFRREYQKALINPVQENRFRQLNLNQWVKQSIRWMPMHLWDQCDFEIIDSFLEGRECYGALDLAATQDMSAFVLVFPPQDDEDKFIVLPFYWLPADNLEALGRKSHVDYDDWVKKGHLELTGGIVIDYKFIKKKLAELSRKYDIREVAYDSWGAKMLVSELEDAGVNVVGFGQGYKSMSEPSKELYRFIAQKKIAHGGHPILRWNFDNMIMRIDESGNIKPDREKVTDKIDGAVAMTMALARAIVNCTMVESGLVVYDGSNWYRNGELLDVNED
jgi:phage terminase large subunit-like protein